MRQYIALNEEEELYEFIPQEEHGGSGEEDTFAEDDSKLIGVVRRV